jgi:endo-1,4-beta-xylanase
MRKPNIILGLAALLITTGIVFSAYKSKEINSEGLKDYYRKYFPIGVAVTPYDLSGDKRNLILKQFNSITSENAMKMGPIHPMENAA